MKILRQVFSVNSLIFKKYFPNARHEFDPYLGVFLLTSDNSSASSAENIRCVGKLCESLSEKFQEKLLQVS